MEIDANMNLGPLNGLTSATRSAPGPKPAGEDDSFADASALETALKNTSEIRPEAVARGLNLVNNANYPSDAAVKKLSDFLASQLQPND